MQEKLVELFAEKLPPLKRVKSPIVAAFVAVVFGGFGLALYLRSAVDAAVAAVAMVVLFMVISAGVPIGTLATFVALAQYAFTRVEASNRQLSGARVAAPQPAA